MLSLSLALCACVIVCASVYVCVCYPWAKLMPFSWARFTVDLAREEGGVTACARCHCRCRSLVSALVSRLGRGPEYMGPDLGLVLARSLATGNVHSLAY